MSRTITLKYDVGQTVYWVARTNDDPWLVEGGEVTCILITKNKGVRYNFEDGIDCVDTWLYATKEEAQAECDRLNSEQAGK